MDRMLGIYFNLNTEEIELENQMNMDDNYTQLRGKDLILMIKQLNNWNDIEQEIYDELFKEFNIDLEKFKDENGFYDIDNVIGELEEIIWG